MKVEFNYRRWRKSRSPSTCNGTPRRSRVRLDLVGDHLVYDLPDGARGPGEAWTTLAAIAATTERVEIGRSSPAPVSATHRRCREAGGHRRRDSQGRLILDSAPAGTGENTTPSASHTTARQRLEEAFTIIRTLLRDGEIDFHGQFYDVDRCVRRIPITPTGWTAVDARPDRPRMQSIKLPHVDA